jgi:hypothetical protein
MSKIKIVLIAIFVLGALVRAADVLRPIDKPSWRECDLGSISRNFVREGFNPLMPQIDWRGNSPGYAEMEFTLYPALIGASYKVFGVHDFIGRVWAFLFSLGTLFFFFKLARHYLDDFFSIFAALFFTFNPLVIDISTSIQPEGLMIFTYVAAAWFFIKWLDEEKDKYFLLALIATALTLLAKATAGHIGLFFGVLLLQKYGLSIFKQGKVWLFGIFSLAPCLLWYLHAKSLWKSYGNSLGVSNEYHWVGPDFFTNPYFLKGILKLEFLHVWIIFGLVVGAFAIWRGWGEKTARHALIWLAAIFLMYFAAARTTADDWASYYHIFSVPPAALLFGFGIKKLWDYMRKTADHFSDFSLPRVLLKVCLIFIIALSAGAALLYEGVKVRANFFEKRLPDAAFVCASKIKPALKEPGLILASGGNCSDPDGYPVAFNSSFMFYWLERKGFNICVEEQTADKVEEFAAKGARYFVAARANLAAKPEFEADLRRRYPIVSECDEFYVFDLTTGK